VLYAARESGTPKATSSVFVFPVLLLQVFFNGGILSNDASTPVNGSAFEVLDLRTLSPYVIQVRMVSEDPLHDLAQRSSKMPEASSLCNPSAC
jgi:hypothetical protein